MARALGEKKCKKRRFERGADAAEAVRQSQATGGRLTTFYRCTRCDGFHTTSMPQRRAA